MIDETVERFVLKNIILMPFVKKMKKIKVKSTRSLITCAQAELQRHGRNLVVLQVQAAQPGHEHHVAEAAEAIARQIQALQRRERRPRQARHVRQGVEPQDQSLHATGESGMTGGSTTKNYTRVHMMGVDTYQSVSESASNRREWDDRFLKKTMLGEWAGGHKERNADGVSGTMNVWVKMTCVAGGEIIYVERRSHAD